VAVLGAGEHFGEGTVLAQEGKGWRTASIRAETALDVVTLRQDEFRRLTESLGALNKLMQRSIAARRSYADLIDFMREEPEAARVRCNRSYVLAGGDAIS
jgi:CRP-like cAMP-binding protein